MSDQPTTEVRRLRASRSLWWWSLACLVLLGLCYWVAISAG